MMTKERSNEIYNKIVGIIENEHPSSISKIKEAFASVKRELTFDDFKLLFIDFDKAYKKFAKVFTKERIKQMTKVIYPLVSSIIVVLGIRKYYSSKKTLIDDNYYQVQDQNTLKLFNDFLNITFINIVLSIILGAFETKKFWDDIDNRKSVVSKYYKKIEEMRKKSLNIWKTLNGTFTVTYELIKEQLKFMLITYKFQFQLAEHNYFYGFILILNYIAMALNFYYGLLISKLTFEKLRETYNA